MIKIFKKNHASNKKNVFFIKIKKKYMNKEKEF